MVMRFGRCAYSERLKELAVLVPPTLEQRSKEWTTRRQRLKDGKLVARCATDYDTIFKINEAGVRDVVWFAPLLTGEDVPLVEGRYQPLSHQLYTAAFITLNPRCYVLNEPRLGKTGSVILAMDWLQRHGHITGGVLVITTYTTMNSVWKRNIQDTLPNASVVTIHGKGKRENGLNEIAEFYVTNYESVRLSADAFASAVKSGRIGAVVIDELTHVGNASAKRSKAICRLCSMPELRNVVGLTGSPADNIEYVFGMGKVVNPAALPVNTLTGWKNMTMWKYGTQVWQMKPRHDAMDTVFKALQPAVRFKKTDVLDLPPVTEQIRECELSKEQSDHMKRLKQDAVTLLNSGADEKSLLTAANGGVLLVRSLQIAEGIVKTDDGTLVELDHKSRTNTIIEAIQETSRKVLIFSPFVAGCDIIRNAVEEAGYKAEVITGAVTGKRRDMILRKFQEEDDPRVLVCHPKTVGFGTELSAADTMIFSVPLMLGGFVYNQSLERLSSLKQQSKNINIIHIVSSPIEKRILKGLRENHEQAQMIAGLFELVKSGKF